MRRRQFAAILPAALVLSSPSRAEEWPTRPVRVIVPYPPGSGTDIVGRVLAQKLQSILGQPVVVENRSGAGGTLGTDAGAKATADGYTFLISDVGPLAMAPHLYRRLPYDPVADFEAVSLIARLPFVLVVHPSVQARTLGDFVTYAKAHPGEVTYASVGNGSATHLAMELSATSPASSSRMSRIAAARRR